jgi:hypothetical protein
MFDMTEDRTAGKRRAGGALLVRLASLIAPPVLALVQVLSPMPTRAQTCESAFLTTEERLARLGPDFVSIRDGIRNLPIDVVNGKRAPKWSDLDKLQKLIESVRNAKALLRAPEAKREFNAVALQMARELDSDPKLKDLATAHRWYQPTNRYQPTEYKLKLEYQRLLGKLNHELPRGARIPIQRLPVDLRRGRINQEAREFMREFEKSFEQRFPTTGYRTYEEYEAYLRNSDNPEIKKALEMIDKGQIEVVIRRPESGRFWVPKVGLQNQYVTGSSGGTFDPAFRKKAEQRLYDLVGEDAYRDQDPEFMPKYGTFRPKPESGVGYNREGSSQYGSDFYVLRLSDVQDRLSFTPNDSLYVGAQEGPLTHWSGTFIPWKYRLLMVEFMVDGLKGNAMVFPSRGRWSELIAYYFSYWETQILGTIDLSNVESFQFTANPPSGAFLYELLEREIPIYNARKWPPVEWHPSPAEREEAKAMAR